LTSSFEDGALNGNLGRAIADTLVSQVAVISSLDTDGRILVNEIEIYFKDIIRDGIVELELILDNIRLNESNDNNVVESDQPLGTGIFIVHGHDELARESVARFVERLGLEAIILQDQPHIGRTIIEKFEEESVKVGFALVLMTPDDVGSSQTKPDEMRSRARQNVIFELGYFAARLGRRRVCLLYKGNVEIPSDLYGVLYILIDDSDSWKLRVAREMRAAGLEFDLNQVL
jgi:predicted nucleotide-binding protein